MGTHRAHIVFPEDLAAQIDEIAGTRGRSAFVVETMRAEVKRQRMLSFLKEMEKTPAWKDENHPELKKSAAVWVRKLREESSERERRTAKRRKPVK